MLILEEAAQAGSLEEYREALMWGCRHELSYDPQSEGNHSLQLYDMISCFPDPLPFIEEIAKRMKKCWGWEYDRDCELLAYFTLDGNNFAWQTLLDEYKRLHYLLLKKRTRRSNKEAESYEFLCVSLVTHAPTDEAAVKRYLFCAANMGNLITKSRLYRDDTFDWFQAASEDRIGEERLRAVTDKERKNNDLLDAYFKVCEKKSNEWKRDRRGRPFKTAEEIFALVKDGLYLNARSEFIRLARNDRADDIKALVEYYENETDERAREILLFLFEVDKAELLNFQRLKDDALSQNTELSMAAFEVMGKRPKSKEAREIALSCAENNVPPEIWLPALIKNYEPCDKKLLVKSVKAVRVNFGGGAWHGIFARLRDAFREEKTKVLPEELLLYMYEKMYCSCCRYWIVEEMEKRSILTDDIIRECMYDSYDETRELARAKAHIH